MHGLGRVVQAMALGALCAGCSSWWSQDAPKPEQREKKTPPPLYLGAVHQVYPAQKFALLRIIGPMPSPGATLITHPADGSNHRLGNLVVSDNSKPQRGMVVADIRSGTVVSGDRVFLYRNVAPPDEKSHSPVNVAQSNSDEEPPRPAPLRLRTYGTVDLPGDEATQPADSSTAAQEALDPPSPTSQPSSPLRDLPTPASTPHARPDYLDDIPDDISGWN